MIGNNQGNELTSSSRNLRIAVQSASNLEDRLAVILDHQFELIDLVKDCPSCSKKFRDNHKNKESSLLTAVGSSQQQTGQEMTSLDVTEDQKNI